jgi:CBS domain-containing protein
MSTQLVKDFMTPNPITIRATESLETVVKVLEENHIRGLPVVDDQGKILGIISEADLLVREAPLQPPLYLTFLGSVIYFESPEHFHQHLKKSLGMQVQDVMTPDPVITTVDVAISEVAQIMLEQKVTRLPVVDANQNLIGIITRHDLIRALKPQLSANG